MQSLSGEWQFQREGAGDEWTAITLPSSFEEHEGVEFDGIGVYRRTIPPMALPQRRRAVLHFQGAATLAEVWFDGKRLGEHLGGWTPFRFDVSDLVRANQSGKPHEIRIRVDEKVGHNSQGFLPVVCPHFGGVWQEVLLLLVPDTWINDLETFAVGDTTTGSIQLRLPLEGQPPGGDARLAVRYRLRGTEEWSPRQEFSAQVDKAMGNGGVIQLEVPVTDWKWWSPREPNLYEVEIGLTLGNDAATSVDRFAVRAAFRTIEAQGRRLFLNGKPLSVRGLLNWGYAPPRVAPSIDEASMRRDLQFARARGFNLMKFCLWVPPKRYLELADELGMLIWMEYPTWHSKWAKDQLPTLRREFAEFFCYDRNHPSVVLRSLTCEAGPSADLEVIRNLYDLCHTMVPGSIVEDDSSWISWNRIHDFYDDHPYGNNHTWVATLDRLKKHIVEHGPKPLVLGEAICADTWIDREAILRRIDSQTERPFWVPAHFDDTARWQRQIRDACGPQGLENLAADALRYGMLMRKYQAETFRREVPEGGYVISVIRDFPKASMGLIDFAEQSKWTEEDWRWQRNTLSILKTEDDRRSFAAGELVTAELFVSHFGDTPLRDGELTVSLQRPGTDVAAADRLLRRSIDQEVGTLEKALDLEFRIPDVAKPEPWIIRAELRVARSVFVNHWPIWVVPRPIPKTESLLRLHESFPAELAQALLVTIPESTSPASDEVVLTSRLDGDLMNYIETGGRVLLLADGQKGSFPVTDHWFLKGAPYVSNHPFTEIVPRELFVELQHFDLAGPVIPKIDYLDQIDPILLLWATHDMDHVETHGLLFETRVGRGRLLVSALRHTGRTNAAGRWLLAALVDHLAHGRNPRQALKDDVRRRMREKLDEAKISLLGKPWRFAPDPTNNGLKNAWHLPSTSDEDWKEIRIGQAWEAQGYPQLDGWAWYRIAVEVPLAWKGRPLYVSFEGVDDYYELYINGMQAGSGGNIEKRETAFEERKSHPVTEFVVPGNTAHIAVRVHDWYGAGGLFRPITLGTVRIASGPTLLK